MANLLPSTYLTILVAFLAVASGVIFFQIFRTRKTESQLSKLLSKLSKEKGTAQDLYQLGSIYLEKKLFNQAAVYLKKALRAQDLEDTEGFARISNALGYAYFAQEQYDLAIRQYKEALKAMPKYVVALNNLGHAYERKQLASQALETYEKSLKHDPKNSTAKRRADSLRKRLAPSS